MKTIMLVFGVRKHASDPYSNGFACERIVDILCQGKEIV